MSLYLWVHRVHRVQWTFHTRIFRFGKARVNSPVIRKGDIKTVVFSHKAPVFSLNYADFNCCKIGKCTFLVLIFIVKAR